MTEIFDLIAKLASAPWYYWLAFFVFIGFVSFNIQMQNINSMSPDEKAEWMEKQRRKSLGLE